MAMVVRSDELIPTDVPEFGRDEFIEERWEYKRGEHVTFLAPTQTGKTTLKFELFKVTLTKNLKAVSLIMKPKDEVPEAYWKTLKFDRVEDWPPSRARKLVKNPSGYLVWPRHTFDPAVDNKNLRRIFRKAILWCYRHGNVILDIDEILGVADELNLDDELVAVWSRGASMGCGLWGGSQRPSGIPLQAYSQASHFFIGQTSDKRDRDRLRDISGIGIDPDAIADIVEDLGDHEWLYIRKRGHRMCRILAS
jgi:hypothetical protein